MHRHVSIVPRSQVEVEKNLLPLPLPLPYRGPHQKSGQSACTFLDKQIVLKVFVSKGSLHPQNIIPM